jgi:hypothetical protein
MAKKLHTLPEPAPPLPPVTLMVQRYSKHAASSVDESDLPEQRHRPAPLPCHVQDRQILEAARMLFDEPDLSMGASQKYEALYTGVKFSNTKPPSVLRSILQERAEDAEADNASDLADAMFFALQGEAVQLAVLVLAFAHVPDVADIGDLPLSSAGLIVRSRMYKKAKTWDGVTPLIAIGDEWFQLIALLMTGAERDDNEVDNTCLISDHGWSIYVNTFGEPDPAYISEYSQ